MLKAVGKVARGIRRKHFNKLIIGSGGFCLLGGVIALATVSVGAPLAGAAVFGLAAGALGGGLGMVFGGVGDELFIGGDYTYLNSRKLIGEVKYRRDLEALQRLINEKTKSLKHVQVLPEELYRNLLAHIRDVESSVRRLRIYDNDMGARTFAFTREYYDASGRSQTQEIAVIELQLGGAIKEAAKPAVFSPAPAPQQTQANSEFLEMFNKLSNELKEARRDIRQLKFPSGVKLDKPDFKGPSPV